MAQNRHDDLRLMTIAFGEERADRAVDEAGDKRLLLARATFALEIAAGDAACRERLFLVVDGQREEVDADLRGLGGDDGGQNAGLAP